MKKLLLVLLSIIGNTYSSEQKPLQGESTICFADGTQFGPFEQAFRAKYKHLDIPPIQVTDESDARYFFIYKIIQFNPAKSYSQLNAQYTLLHESGHHNYSCEERQKNHDAADQAINSAMKYTGTALTGCKNVLTVANGYHILFRKPHIRLLMAQGIVMELLSRPEMVNSALEATVFPVMAIKPEEYAADAFANQHATQDVLRAEQYLTSKKGFIAQYKQDGKDTLDYVMERQRVEPSSSIMYQAKCAAIKACSKMGLPWYYLSAVIDLEHPSQSQRHKIVSQALHDRFGVEA